MKKKIIVYDFDKTIYNGETGTDFYKFYLKKYPFKTLIFSIKYIKEIILYLFKKINLKELKERFFKFLEIYTKEEINEIIDEFWEINKKYNYNWFEEEILKNKREAEILIATSASPKFLLEKHLKKMGFDVVFGTDFQGDNKEKFISKIEGENNKGKEKVVKLNKWAEKNNIDYKIMKFYSDSIADKPLFDLAEEKIWIKKGEKVLGVPNKKTIIDKLFWK